MFIIFNKINRYIGKRDYGNDGTKYATLIPDNKETGNMLKTIKKYGLKLKILFA